jgi:ubiquinone/menaquinone biosynthesis C-methylase UbiE
MSTVKLRFSTHYSCHSGCAANRWLQFRTMKDRGTAHKRKKMQKLINLYKKINEENRLDYDRARNIEFIITTKIIDQYLKPEDKILDLGCGVGKYSLHYNQIGHFVWATDIVPKHIDKLHIEIDQKKLNGIKCSIDDATNLLRFKQNSVDFLFCLGPYYHLRTFDERQRCLSECFRVLKPNGFLAIAYINRIFAIYYYAKNNIYLSKDIISKLSDKNVEENFGIDDFLDNCFLTTPSEIEKEIEENENFEIIDHAGVDSINSMIPEQLNKMTDIQWQQWCYFNFQTCKERTTIGMSSHGLVICKKEEKSAR